MRPPLFPRRARSSTPRRATDILKAQCGRPSLTDPTGGLPRVLIRQIAVWTLNSADRTAPEAPQGQARGPSSGRPCDPRRRAIGSLSVALRAQPRDLAVAVHPVVNVGLALETSDFSRFGAWVLSDDSPVIIRVTNWPEGHFCFCHAALCRQRP
jgi:hypothetical protein